MSITSKMTFSEDFYVKFTLQLEFVFLCYPNLGNTGVLNSILIIIKSKNSACFRINFFIINILNNKMEKIRREEAMKKRRK